MTKRVETARHRAAATTGAVDILSKAVAANAGNVSRQAAAVAAAGGLVVTLGVTGAASASKIKAAPKGDTTTATLDIQRAANTEIHAKTVKAAPKGGSLVKVVAKPAAPERELAESTITAPAVEAPTTQETLPKLEQTAPATTATTTTASETETQAKPSSSDSSSETETQAQTKSSSSSSSSDASATTKTVASSVDNSSIVSTAMSYVGSPYVHGGTTPSGWDCIGFVRYVFAQHGVSIGGSPSSVLSVGKRVPYSQVQAGDILYWPGHVAISLGGSKNVGAWNPGMGTKVGPNSWVGGTPTVIRVG